MKRAKTKNATGRRRGRDEMLPEYDFSRARPNKSTLVVTLDPDVAAVFRGADEVNEALRALAVVVKKVRR